MKPLINLDELELEHSASGSFEQKYGLIAEKIGARKLGYNLTIVPPGKKSVPFHNHHNNEEMFFILEGTGTLRFGAGEHAVRENDVIACPPGGPEVAHQFINTGKVDLKYLAVSTMESVEVAEFPDSKKIVCSVGREWPRKIRHVTRHDQAVDYMDGEE